MIELSADSSAPRHWDYVLSCFEPITRVTGGIGTYTRLLLEQLSELSIDGRPIEILFFTGERQRAAELSAFCPRAHVMFVPSMVKLGESPLNNLTDPYQHFGVGMMRAMQTLERSGHSFGYLEVPDYSAEGYYVLKARRFGLLKLGRVGVRLHSPLFMLHEDNASLAWCDSSAFRFHDMERSCIALADDVLFGGDAMRDRVCGMLTAEQKASALSRAVKIPHPWPSGLEQQLRAPASRNASTVRRLGYVGRLEYRKGVDLLVEAALEALKTCDFELHFFGKDTATWRLSSMREQLDRLLVGHPKAHRLVFHDHVEQAALWNEHLPAMDGFVFPSRFENYPNVLLEVLRFGRPVVVSRFGCMPEVSQGFGQIRSVDPTSRTELAQALVATAQEPLTEPRREAYGFVREAMNAHLRQGYQDRLKQPPPKPASIEGELPSITFVIAHYNQSRFLPALLDSLKSELLPGDGVIVVDDCSRPEEAEAARNTVTEAGFIFLSTAKNSGPAHARNLGIQQATTDAIYIVDADDLIEPHSTAPLRETLARDPTLEVVSGYFQAFEDEHHAWASYDPIVETILLEHSSHCGILARREVFQRLGGYSEAQRDHFEDWEFTMRLALAGVRFEVAPLVTYRYRVRKSTSRNNTRLDRAGYSYESAVRSALAASAVDWERVARFLPALVARRTAAPVSAERDPNLPREVRYTVADRLNLMIKPTLIHKPLKRLVAWSLGLKI